MKVSQWTVPHSFSPSLVTDRTTDRVLTSSLARQLEVKYFLSFSTKWWPVFLRMVVAQERRPQVPGVLARAVETFEILASLLPQLSQRPSAELLLLLGQCEYS